MKFVFNALSGKFDLVATSEGHVVQDEGSPLTQRAALNFIGSAVTVTDNAGGSTDVTITQTSALAFFAP